jgi:beta-lactamase superfamily II metal-dependent hydrolase
MDNANKLLVRVYDVGFGDCVYVRVPDTKPGDGEASLQHYHILIDCGSIQWQDSGKPKPKKKLDKLERALEDVRSMLPQEQGSTNKRLDLLLVTHSHADHYNGFDPNLFEGITIGRIWLSALMYKEHSQAKGARALKSLAFRATWSLALRGLALGVNLQQLLLAKQSKANAEAVLTKTLPDSSGIKPLYLWRDIASKAQENLNRLPPQKWAELQPLLNDLEFKDGTTCLKCFPEDKTTVRILAPEWNIDGEYLGKDAVQYQALLDRYPAQYPMGTADDDYRLLLELDEHGLAEQETDIEAVRVPRPDNISESDFRTLRNRLFYAALRYTGEEHEIGNNTSVVLLLEWRGRRLLFAGDAQWKGGYEKGRHNGNWDVMYEVDDKLAAGKRHLAANLDYLKVGHHGSENATPWEPEKPGAEHPRIETILPMDGTAKMVLSTCKTNRWANVPSADLIKVLGARGELLQTNTSSHLNYPPTDPFAIDVTFDAAPGWKP